MTWDFTFTLMIWDFLILAVASALLILLGSKSGKDGGNLQVLAFVLLFIFISSFAMFFVRIVPQILEYLEFWQFFWQRLENTWLFGK